MTNRDNYYVLKVVIHKLDTDGLLDRTDNNSE